MRVFLAGLLLATGLPAGIAAQDQQPSPRQARDETEAYREYKQREFEQNRQAFAALNKLPTLQAMVQLVQQQDPFKNRQVRGDTASAQNVVRAQLTKTIAHYLTAVGISPDEVRTLQRNGFDPVESAVAVIGGGGTAVDRAVIAEYAVIGDVTAVNESSDKSVNSTITVKPTRIVKAPHGQALQGNIEIELNNPFRHLGSDSLGSVVLAPGQSYLFFLSKGWGEFQQARGQRRSSRAGAFRLQTSPYAVRGDALVPTASDPVHRRSPMALAAFTRATSALAPVSNSQPTQ